MKCLGYGTVLLPPHGLDHPIALGIGGMGSTMASAGVHKVKPCSGPYCEIVRRYALVIHLGIERA